MMKKVLLAGCVAATMLSGCTSVENFTRTTTQTANFQLTGNTAKMRLTTNVWKVFATPNRDCVDIQHSGLINQQNPYDLRDDKGFSLKRKPLKEFVVQDLGLKAYSVEQLKQKTDWNPYGFTYLSKDMVINADKPLTIFITTTGGRNLVTDIMEVATKSSLINDTHFGFSFTPKQNHHYQLVLEENMRNDAFGTGKYYYNYRYRLYDVTNGDMIYINHLTSRLKECGKN